MIKFLSKVDLQRNGKLQIIKKYEFGLKTTIGKPSGFLCELIDNFFELEGKPEYKQHRIIPACSSEVLFNLGESVHGSGPSAKEKIHFSKYIVSGIRTGFFNSIPGKKVHFTGIKFRINGVRKLFNLSPSELTNNDYNLDEVISPKYADDIYEKLADCSSAEERFILLAGLCAKKLNCNNNSNLLVKEILAKPMQTIMQLSSYTGFTRQYLHRIFKSETGISIKQYQRIQRISSMPNNPCLINKSFASLAYDYGYFDQSHLIKEFRQFTGFTPAEYYAIKGRSSGNLYLS